MVRSGGALMAGTPLCFGRIGGIAGGTAISHVPPPPQGERSHDWWLAVWLTGALWCADGALMAGCGWLAACADGVEMQRAGAAGAAALDQLSREPRRPQAALQAYAVSFQKGRLTCSSRGGEVGVGDGHRREFFRLRRGIENCGHKK